MCFQLHLGHIVREPIQSKIRQGSMGLPQALLSTAFSGAGFLFFPILAPCTQLVALAVAANQA